VRDRRWVGSGVRRGMGRSGDGKASWRRGWGESGRRIPCVGIDGLGRPEVHKDRRVRESVTTRSHVVREEGNGIVHAGRLQAAKPEGTRAAEVVDGRRTYPLTCLEEYLPAPSMAGMSSSKRVLGVDEGDVGKLAVGCCC
jgi:hypothetical protein